MKKILTLLMILFFTSVFSQGGNTIQYPRFEVDSLGQKVVVMTIPQAMKLNTNSNLLAEFQNLSDKMKDYETICVKVVNDKNEVIAKQDITINKLDEQVKVKDEKILALQGEIVEWIKKNNILETQLKNRNDKIDLQDKQISRLKTKMLITGIGGSVVTVGLVLVLVGVIR